MSCLTLIFQWAKARMDSILINPRLKPRANLSHFKKGL